MKQINREVYGDVRVSRLMYLLGILFFVLILSLLLGGCTFYTVEKVSPDGSSTIVSVKSTRSFEQPNLAYTRTGQDATFDFKAAGADNNTAVIVSMFAPIIQGMMTGRFVLAPPAQPPLQ